MVSGLQTDTHTQKTSCCFYIKCMCIVLDQRKAEFASLLEEMTGVTTEQANKVIFGNFNSVQIIYMSLVKPTTKKTWSN